MHVLPLRCGSRSRVMHGLALAMALAGSTLTARAATLPNPPAGYVVESVSVREGLPLGECNAMMQSREGYLWVGTSEGLARYDGMRLRVYDKINTPGLTSNQISFLLEARDGALWFTTADAGVGVLREGRITMYPPDSCLAGGGARRLIETSDGSIWVSHTRGIARWRAGVMAPVAPDVIKGATLVMVDDGGGGIWTSTVTGVAHVTERGVRQWKLTPDAEQRGWWQPYRDPSGRLWLATHQGLLVMRGDQFVPYAPPGLPADEPWRVMYPDPTSDQPVLRSMGTFARFVDGGWRLHRPGLKSRFRSDPAWDGSHMWYAMGAGVFRDEATVLMLPSESTGLLLDRAGDIWVSTANDGVFRIRASRVTMAGSMPLGANRDVSALGAEDDGSLWIGAFGMPPLYRRDGLERTPPMPTSGMLSSILTWVREGPNRYLAATVVGLERVVLHPDRAPERTVLLSGVGRVGAVARAPDATIWVANESNVLRGANNQWSTVPDSVLGTRAPATTIACDAGGRAWIGTAGAGVIVLDGDRAHRVGLAEGLPGGLVQCVVPAADGGMWVGLGNAGLVHVTLGADGAPRLRTVSTKDGLHDNSIASLVEDGEGRLWMGTAHGIAVVTLEALTARLSGGRELLSPIVFDEGDGMATGLCNHGAGAAVRGRDGRVWIATRDGAAGIPTSAARQRRAPTAPVVEELLVEGVEAPVRDGVVQLAADQRNFTVHFSAPTFDDPAHLRFRHRLLGVDRDWVNAGPRREATYARVSPGAHRFEVQVADGSGRWIPATATVLLRVAPAFQETWLFRGLVLLALLALVAAAYAWRVRRYRDRQRELTALVSQRTRELEEALATVAAQTKSLEDLDRAKSRFFANISHEFRTPLTLTLGPLEDVLSGATGELPGEARTELDVALRNSRRLLHLVNEILDLAKLESGRLQIAVREADLREALTEWSQAFHPLAERRRITFETVFGEKPLMLWFDRERLGKAVSNLLSNAFKFTPEGGRVVLTAAEIDGAIRVDVRDTGPGIPQGERERIFERFYQVDETRRRLTPGTGIGLALARELVELHGGRIEVASGPEPGAVFTLWLRSGRAHLGAVPIANGDGAEVHAQPALALPDPSLSPPAATASDGDVSADREPGDVTTVLVVDDHDELRALVRRGLAQRYRVIEAADGEEALAMARTSPPDLVVSDVMMPGLDGFQLVEAFRADPELDYIPIVLLTARAESEDRIAGLTRGADDYVEKPFRADELRARVDNLIASRRRLRERFTGEYRIRSSVAPPESADRAYLEHLREVIGARLGEEDFNVAKLAEAMRQDRTHLFRKVRDLLGVAPADLLRSARLERAAELLAAREGGVSEIAYATGFKSVSHFSTAFRLRFGETPSAYARQQGAAMTVEAERE